MPLSIKEIQVLHEYVANGGNATRAWLSVYPGEGFNNARNYGSDLVQSDDGKNHLAKVREASLHDVFRQSALTYDEKRSFLAAAVRTPVSAIDETSPLAEEVIQTEDGKRIKSVSKVKAIALDNAMAGHNAPDKVISATIDLDGLLEHVTGQRVIEVEEIAIWD